MSKQTLHRLLAFALVLILAMSLASACGTPQTNDPVVTVEEEPAATPTTAPTATPVPEPEPVAEPEPEPEAEPEPEPEPEPVYLTKADLDLEDFLRDWGVDPVHQRPADSSSAADPDTPLVVGYDQFSEKFSPFFSTTAYDGDVSTMTQISTLTTDRVAEPVFNAIQGETRTYNGTPYFYSGPANTYLSYDDVTDITTYRIRLRRDMVFSDGKPVTVDDLIFSMYAFLDEDFDGASTYNSYDIVGYKNYVTQLPDTALDKYTPIVQALYEAGKDYTASGSDPFDQAQLDNYWNGFAEIWADTCDQINDACCGPYFGYFESEAAGFTPDDLEADEELFEKMRTVVGMNVWGFGDVEEVDGEAIFVGGVTGTEWNLSAGDFPTPYDYFLESYEAYGGDFLDYWDVEDPAGNGGVGILNSYNNKMILEFASSDTEIETGEVKSITGIKRINDYAVEVQLHGFEAPAVYAILDFPVAPLHYYGSEALYDYDNGKYGFPRGDLSLLREKTTVPMGAGPYVFIEYENNVVYFEANPNYFEGEPLIKYIQYKVVPTVERVSGLGNGVIDAGEMSYNKDRLAEIMTYNANNEITGDVITTEAVMNLGYGYIALYAPVINVGGVLDSVESKNLRKGLATIFAVFRDFACYSYYGETASVINYPISNTNWAAPQPTDSGYEIAFSRDVNGNPIYTADMTPDERYEAAKVAAVGFFEAAGFKVEDGKVVEGPEGPDGVRHSPVGAGDLSYLEYELVIPADGVGDHPAFWLVTEAASAFADIGITLVINDPANSNVLWDSKDAGTLEIWTAAWGSTPDPDMYQIYHSSSRIGSTDYNDYGIVSAKLDSLMMDARRSDDIAYRKAVYKQCLDEILDWAVEIPNYQRSNFQIFSSERLQIDTLINDMTPFYGWKAEIINVDMY